MSLDLVQKNIEKPNISQICSAIDRAIAETDIRIEFPNSYIAKGGEGKGEKFGSMILTYVPQMQNEISILSEGAFEFQESEAVINKLKGVNIKEKKHEKIEEHKFKEIENKKEEEKEITGKFKELVVSDDAEKRSEIIFELISSGASANNLEKNFISYCQEYSIDTNTKNAIIGEIHLFDNNYE